MTLEIQINRKPRISVIENERWLFVTCSLDGRLCEGSNMSEPPSGTGADRPLTQTSSPVSYAGSVRRPESSADGTPPRHYSGKPDLSSSPVSTQPSTSPWRLESYATVLQQGKSGPQMVGIDGVSEIDIILDGRGNSNPVLRIYHYSERRTHF